MKSRASEHFASELGSLISRFRQEYELTYSEAIGCLAMAQHVLCVESQEDDGEDDIDD